MKKAKLLFTESESSDDEIDLTVFDTSNSPKSAALSILSATALGSILSAECGNLLWKQRLTHISVKRIIECVVSNRNPAEIMVPTPSTGSLAAISHLVCSSNLQNISTSDLEGIARLMTSGIALKRQRVKMPA